MEKAIIDNIRQSIEEFADCRDEMDSQKVAVEIYEMVAQEIGIVTANFQLPPTESASIGVERWY